MAIINKPGREDLIVFWSRPSVLRRTWR